MKHWLAFDTSTDRASITLKTQGHILQAQIDGVALHAAQALVQIESLLAQANISFAELNGILVGRGPGSFTGLRVASAVAKGLAYSHQIPIYPVSNLAILAWQAQKLYPESSVLAVMDARMQQVYWAVFSSVFSKVTEHVTEMSAIVPPSQPWVLASFRLPSPLIETKGMFAATEAEMSTLAMIEMLEAGGLLPVSAENFEPVYVRDQVTHGS